MKALLLKLGSLALIFSLTGSFNSVDPADDSTHIEESQAEDISEEPIADISKDVVDVPSSSDSFTETENDDEIEEEEIEETEEEVVAEEHLWGSWEYEKDGSCQQVQPCCRCWSQSVR